MADSHFRQLIVEGDGYRYSSQIMHALECYQKAYASPEIKDSVDVQLELLKHIMYGYDLTANNKALSETVHQLTELAGQHHAEAYLAMADFMRGKYAHYQERHEEGMRLCLSAIERLKESDYAYKNRELGYYYAALTRMLTHDKKYAEAMRISQAQEQLARQNASLNEGHIDTAALYRVYTVRARLLVESGRIAESDSCYARSQQLGITDLISDHDLIPYLYQRQRYEEMLAVVQQSKAALEADGNTLGIVMSYLLNEEGRALYELGRYQESAQSFKQMKAVQDHLYSAYSDQMVTAVHEAIDQEKALASRNMLLVIVAVVVLFLIGIVVALIIHDRFVHHRNELMASTMSRLAFYRDRSIERKNENPDETGENTATPSEDDAMEQRFLEVDYEITKDKLFCRPDFGRDDLTRMMGVDKNTLPGLISRFTGTNVVWYINSKRMDYAASLMKEHPEYTMNAIAEACGIKSPATFINHFRTTFGMTPSDYRKTLETTPPKRIIDKSESEKDRIETN